MNYEYYVLVKIDKNNCVTDINSTAHISELEDGWIKTKYKGSGNTYGHAQPNFLYDVFGKHTYDEKFHPNFKFVDNDFVELTDEEKATLFPIQKTQPTELDLLKEQQERTDAALQDLILMTLGGE